jgi:hypothetical protein
VFSASQAGLEGVLSSFRYRFSDEMYTLPYNSLGKTVTFGKTHSSFYRTNMTVLKRTSSRQEETMTVEANKKNDEAAIQRLLDDGIRSVRSKNIEGVMSLYAQEVVSFDIVPPLRYMAQYKHW